MADGEVLAYRSGRLLALAWRAPSKRKEIVMITTKDSAQQAIGQQGELQQSRLLLTTTTNP